MDRIPLSDIPRYFKQRLAVPVEAKDKSVLDAALVALLEDYFAVPRLNLDHEAVEQALSGMREWKAELVFAKLRSLLEKQTRRDIQQYCGSLSREDRTGITKKLHAAGIHHFRENLETDLYVGIHTAISANFKMFGVVYCSGSDVPSGLKSEAVHQLLTALRTVAVQPLGVLTALDGVFWDSKLFTVPSCFHWNGGGYFEIDAAVLDSSLRNAVIDEAPRGCPAMRARSVPGPRAIDLVRDRCLDVAKRYFLEDSRTVALSG